MDVWLTLREVPSLVLTRDDAFLTIFFLRSRAVCLKDLKTSLKQDICDIITFLNRFTLIFINQVLLKYVKKIVVPFTFFSRV